ncbi:hypothetical protein RCO27_13430 [Sphingosinicella sp. LHD-64]|uniref:hypothetical protein n=1 Tax=Sphingosinicella sp. LHD-64 TaxID=3072139 RepID=UPI0028102270|nr:hypothetical protein [Sphingosinicella sp. LHD-64]MDQ8757228.1 hypothetical protein [Sphingosinicella sp. LHD-64]
MLRRSIILPTLAAAAFTALFILVGWPRINPFGFPDLDNYRVGFQSGWYLFTTLDREPIDFVLNEGLWVYLFDFMYALIGDIDDTFTFVSIVIVFLTSLYVVLRAQAPWYLLFFFNPAFIEIALGQIRSGLAAGLFWTAVNVKGLPFKLALLLAASAIHTSFVLFSLIYLVFHFLRDTRSADAALSNSALTVLVISALALVPTVFREAALSTIGDQRAYQFLEYSSGIFLAIGWASFFVTYLLLRSDRRISFEGFFYGFGAAAALFSAIVGVYGARLVSIAIPALAVMCFQIDPRYRVLFIGQFIGFSGLYFVYWLS